jgi:type IX secretion system PorP/SprF family membrane protein
MRKLLPILLLGLLSNAFAQQLPLFSQYYHNPFIYNPSLSGTTEGNAITLITRKQFSGLANSFGTYAATYQTRGLDKKAGFGLYVYNDQANLFRTNAINGSYAYHLPLSKDNTLSFGLGLTALDHRYNANNFFITDGGDPVLAMLGAEGGFTFDMNAGANLKLGNFSFGLANLQLIQNQDIFRNNADQKSYYTLRNHWMVNAAYNFAINDNLSIEPFVLYRKTQTAPGQVDVNVFVNLIDKGYLGLAYRDGMSFSTMVGVQLTPGVTAGYAFDYTTHQFRNALGNTHELALKFNLGAPAESSKKAEEELKLAEAKAKAKELEKEKELEQLNEKVTTLKTKVDDLETELESQKEELAEAKKQVPKVETPKEKEPITPEVKDGTKFYVIAGSFNDSKAAQSYIKTLRDKGYRGYEKLDSKSGRYYVHMGDFTRKEYARDWINKLKESGLPLWIKAM